MVVSWNRTQVSHVGCPQVWHFQSRSLALRFYQVDPLLAQSLTVIKVFIWNVQFSLWFLKGYFGSGNLSFARNDPNTSLKSPSIGNFVDMEKFIEIFLSIHRDYQIFKRQFKIPNYFPLLGLLLFCNYVHFERRVRLNILLL